MLCGIRRYLAGNAASHAAIQGLSQGLSMVEKIKTIWYAHYKSPFGAMLLASDEIGLRAINFAEGRRPVRPRSDWLEDRAPFTETIRQLDGYFEGKLKTFTLPLSLEGSEFQLGVWKALIAIPYGETISYGQLACRVGKPKAARAVGLANGSNPIPIIVPCHRVIGSDGSLTGYGGGLPIKKALLSLEGRTEFSKQGVVQLSFKKVAGLD
jgi:methylated-DNA-[protein]-cysteine S-methyltransferase